VNESIELIALDEPREGLISAHDGANKIYFQGLGDAIMSALSAGVDLVIPAAMFEKMRDDLPAELPGYIKVV